MVNYCILSRKTSQFAILQKTQPSVMIIIEPISESLFKSVAELISAFSQSLATDVGGYLQFSHTSCVHHLIE